MFQFWRFKTLKETMREYIVMGIHSFDSSKDIFNPGFVFPDVDSGFLQDKNVEFDGDLSKINDWIQEVFEKDLARDFPPNVSEEFLEMVNNLTEMFPNMPNDYIKDKVKVCIFLEITITVFFSKQQSPFWNKCRNEIL